MSAVSTASSPDVAVRAAIAIARPVFAAAIWTWYHEHENNVVFSKWFVTVRWSQLRRAVEELAGPEPLQVSTPASLSTPSRAGP